MQVAPSLRLWLIATLACVVALVYWPSSVFLYQRWSDTAATTYTHGWLILLICVALTIRARRELAAAPTQPAPLAHLALAGAILAWLVCYRASIEGLEVPLLPVIFWLAATAAFGWAVGRLLLFPVAYLYFALPIWYPTPLQDLTVLAMHGLLTITGPAALFIGDVIHIPNGAFRIEEGCSGPTLHDRGTRGGGPLWRAAARSVAHPRLAIGTDGGPGGACELGARLYGHRSRLSHRHAELSGARESLRVRLGGVRRDTCGVLLARDPLRTRYRSCSRSVVSSPADPHPQLCMARASSHSSCCCRR